MALRYQHGKESGFYSVHIAGRVLLGCPPHRGNHTAVGKPEVCQHAQPVTALDCDLKRETWPRKRSRTALPCAKCWGLLAAGCLAGHPRRRRSALDWIEAQIELISKVGCQMICKHRCTTCPESGSRRLGSSMISSCMGWLFEPRTGRVVMHCGEVRRMLSMAAPAARPVPAKLDHQDDTYRQVQ